MCATAGATFDCPLTLVEEKHSLLPCDPLGRAPSYCGACRKARPSAAVHTLHSVSAVLELRPPTRRGFSTKGPGYDNLYLHHPERSLGGSWRITLSPYPSMTGAKSPATYSNGTASVGFLYSNGTWTTLSDPSAASPKAPTLFPIHQ